MKLQDILCNLGFHKWSENHNGIRICSVCPEVDRYYGISGMLRYKDEKDNGVEPLPRSAIRKQWNLYDKGCAEQSKSV